MGLTVNIVNTNVSFMFRHEWSHLTALLDQVTVVMMDGSEL